MPCQRDNKQHYRNDYERGVDKTTSLKNRINEYSFTEEKLILNRVIQYEGEDDSNECMAEHCNNEKRTSSDTEGKKSQQQSKCDDLEKNDDALHLF